MKAPMKIPTKPPLGLYSAKALRMSKRRMKTYQAMQGFAFLAGRVKKCLEPFVGQPNNDDTRKAVLASLAKYSDDLKTGKIVVRPFVTNVRSDEKDPTLLHFDFVPPIIRRDALALPRELIQFHLEVEMHKKAD